VNIVICGSRSLRSLGVVIVPPKLVATPMAVVTGSICFSPKTFLSNV
jgi:hypothetical protein